MYSIEDLKKSHDFHLSNIKRYQDTLDEKIKDVEELKTKVAQELAVKKSNNDRNQIAVAEIEKRDKESIQKMRESIDILDKAKAQKLEAEELEKKLNERNDVVNQIESQSTIKTQDLTKREKWIEIEERRLIFLNRKLEILSKDKEIAEKLKEIE